MSASHFDSIAAVYDESLPAHVVEHYLRKRTRFVLEHCNPGKGLDVGCGTGVLAQRLADSGFEMSGLDPSDGMLEILRRAAPSVESAQASATEIPFADDCFDLVLTVAVLHHIADPDDVRRTLSEMIRVAKPGGRVLVWDHNPRNPYWKSLMARVPQDTGQERLIGEAEVVRALTAAGGTILLCAQLGFVPDFTPPWAIRAAAAAERIFERTPGVRRVAAHNVVLATK